MPHHFHRCFWSDYRLLCILSIIKGASILVEEVLSTAVMIERSVFLCVSMIFGEVAVIKYFISSCGTGRVLVGELIRPLNTLVAFKFWLALSIFCSTCLPTFPRLALLSFTTAYRRVHNTYVTFWGGKNEGANISWPDLLSNWGLSWRISVHDLQLVWSEGLEARWLLQLRRDR